MIYYIPWYMEFTEKHIRCCYSLNCLPVRVSLSKATRLRPYPYSPDLSPLRDYCRSTWNLPESSAEMEGEAAKKICVCAPCLDFVKYKL